MPSRLIHLPLEKYKSRYTQYTEGSDGIYSNHFRRLGIEYVPIRPHEKFVKLNQGQVLDVVNRTSWGFEQILDLVELVVNHKLVPGEDVIYLSDFFTPGFEMIPYAQSSVFGPNPRFHVPVYSFCHAQSFDPNDFTHPWESWMRPLEKMWFEYQAGVFCAASEMLPLIADAGISLTKHNRFKVHAVGHVFDKKIMLGDSSSYLWGNKNKMVVWASRWDTEKNPGFFMDLVDIVRRERKDIFFSVSTGQPKITSNDPALLLRLVEYVKAGKILLHEDMDRTSYYDLLGRSRIIFNSALQDWISYVLLDGVINGCMPLFPKWLSFPNALNHDGRFLYENMSLEDAKKKLYALIDMEEPIDVSPIYSKYEGTVARMARYMGFNVNE